MMLSVNVKFLTPPLRRWAQGEARVLMHSLQEALKVKKSTYHVFLIPRRVALLDVCAYNLEHYCKVILFHCFLPIRMQDGCLRADAV